MSDLEFVRVRDKVTGHQFTVASVSVDAERHEVLDKPAVDAAGRPLPDKPNKTPAPAKRAASSQSKSETTAGTPADHPKE